MRLLGLSPTALCLAFIASTVASSFPRLHIRNVSALVSSAGQSAAVPSWDVQSSASAPTDITSLSKAGIDTSSWHHARVSKCTVMACLLADGTYKDSEIFFSDKLKSIDPKQFAVPWLYRSEFALEAAPGRHFLLQTNGITSRADVFLNGEQVADKSVQVGAYGGVEYDITGLVSAQNALLIRAYPTSYMGDLAVGFVDWNPYPPDMGSGVWRDVVVKQTGPVALGGLVVITDAKMPAPSSGTVTIKTTVRNLEATPVLAMVEAVVAREDGSGSKTVSESVALSPGQTSQVTLTASIDNPAIWWPKQWGSQPLYSATVTATVSSSLSDTSTKTFGFRTVTSKLQGPDILFSINSQPFQVIGAGYTSDIFLRWDAARFTHIARYSLDIGLNTLRLEGKMEHPELYDIADRLGIMVLPGWECCDKWEAWSYNANLSPPIPVWSANDFYAANISMAHEAAMQQAHPCILGFLVGSDFWPDDAATTMYVDALTAAGWQTPILASASEQGFPKQLGSPGMKMRGPYDWVPPNYWYDTTPDASRYGAAFGFGSELGAGVGTPELSSLRRFLSPSDIDDLFRQPNKPLYHMSKSDSEFATRKIYNDALWKRFGGAPPSLDEYLLRAQMSDYEATRAQFEAYGALWGAKRPATGLVYWMLNSAWPALHWQLFDYYLQPAGAYFGAKVGARLEHVAYDYQRKSVHLINRSLGRAGARTVRVDVVDGGGRTVGSQTATVQTVPNSSKSVLSVQGVSAFKDVVFLRLTLSDEKGALLSRNVYWLTSTVDTLNWPGSQWFYTPVSKYVNYAPLTKLSPANVTVSVTATGAGEATVMLENTASVPAVFVSLVLKDAGGEDVLPVRWSDNYVTLWPKEKLEVSVGQYGGSRGVSVEVRGRNLARRSVAMS